MERPVPHNLPVRLLPLVGRRADVDAVELLLEQTRLLTITGSGGSGKTRLAAAVAGELVDTYPDGVWFVELGPMTSAGLVAKAVADSLGIPEQPSQTAIETLVGRLQAWHGLIVLDNCEHVIGACASLADSLLKSCPNLRLLATSREPLDTDGEVSWNLPPLRMPATGHALPWQALSQYGAVELFVARAQAADPGFSLTADNAAGLLTICVRLDGIPLAIELAAARIRHLTVDEIVDRLADSLQLLTRGRRTSIPRHRTMRATIDWSYALLEPAERAMLACLSVFAGGFDLEAAEAVWPAAPGDPPTLELIGQLLDRSMLQRSPGRDRYEMLLTIRQYGQERLSESGGLAEARDRHLRHFLGVAEEAERMLRGPGSAACLRRLDAEHDNLRAALEWGLLTEPDRALELASSVGAFWYLRGHLTEGCVWLHDALAEASDVPARLKAHNLLAGLSLRAGDLATADRALRDCRALEHDPAARTWMAETRNNLGLVAYWGGDPDEARRQFDEAIELSQELGLEYTLGHATFHLGLLDHLAGDGTSARRRVQASLAIFRRIADRPSTALALGVLGCIAVDDGDVATATSTLREGMEMSRDIGDKVNLVFGIEAFAQLEAKRGSYRDALRLAAAAAGLREAFGVISFALWQSHIDRALDLARRILGPEASSALWAEGATASLAEAVDIALELADAGADPPHPYELHAGPLSRREREIAELVASGLSNREIAGHRHIAVRTAETHVANVMNKLGLNSRAQVAAWVVEQRHTSPR